MVRNRELKQDLADLSHRLEMIQTVLLVSNPDGPMAAEAYDGLRKTIVGSLKATQLLEASLAQLDQISRSTDDMQDIRIKLRELMGIAKVELVKDHERYPEAFDVIGSGEVRTVTKPAYVALERGAIVARGVLELSSDITAGTEVMAVADPEGVEPGDVSENQSEVLSADEHVSPGTEPHSGRAEESSTTTETALGEHK